MAYTLADDIDLKGKINARVVDAKMETLLADTKFALRQQSHLYPELITLGRDILSLFVITHQSIRVLIAQKKRNPLLFVDAGSLCREQVEKLYALALIISDPEPWIRQYLRNDWKAMYERHLREQDEYHLLSRTTAFFKYEAKTLEGMRHWPDKSAKRGYVVHVSERARNAVKFRFKNPTQYPTYFPSKIFNSYFSFPTPGAALRKIPDPLMHDLLRRWYKEYQYFSSYTHNLGEKVQVEQVFKSKNYYAGKKQEIFRTKKVLQILFTSYTAAATACTIAVQAFDTDFGVRTSLKKFWEELSRAALFSRLIWKGYANKLLS